MKTDIPSLEKLAFLLDERDAANFAHVLTLMRDKNVSSFSVEDEKRMLAGLAKIGELKLNERFYIFSISDSYTQKQGFDGEGVELYHRRGNKLEQLFHLGDRDHVLECVDMIERIERINLFKKRERILYTGNIPCEGEFLGVPERADPDDPKIWSALDDYNTRIFQDADIKVIYLDYLI